MACIYSYQGPKHYSASGTMQSKIPARNTYLTPSQPGKLTRKQIKLHALFLASYCKPTQQPEIWVTQNSTGILLRLLLMQLFSTLPKHPSQNFSFPLTPLPVFAFGPAKLAQGWSREEQHQNEKKFKHSDFPLFQWQQHFHKLFKKKILKKKISHLLLHFVFT